MNPILIAVLALGAIYVFTRSASASGLPAMFGGTGPFLPPYPTGTGPPYNVPYATWGTDAQRSTLPGNMTANQAGPAGPGAIAAGVTTSVAAGVAAPGAIGLGALAVPIVGGLAALTVWGVASQGWFRGGWEGVKGNTFRDKFLQQFVDAFFPGAGSERQYEAIVKAYQEADQRSRALGKTPIDGNVAERDIRMLYQSDSEDSMRSAMRNIVQRFASVGITVLSPL